MSDVIDEPFPGYRFDAAAARRADAAQTAARAAILALDGGSLFDTEPAQIARTLAVLKDAEA